MIININPPRHGRTEKETIRELETWARDLTDVLNLILSNIGEDNFSDDLLRMIKENNDG